MRLNTSGLRVGGANRISWVDEAAKMRANPGTWFFLTERVTNDGVNAFMSQIRRGVLYSFRPTGDFEARREDHQVWARYLGDGAA